MEKAPSHDHSDSHSHSGCVGLLILLLCLGFFADDHNEQFDPLEARITALAAELAEHESAGVAHDIPTTPSLATRIPGERKPNGNQVPKAH